MKALGKTMIALGIVGAGGALYLANCKKVNKMAKDFIDNMQKDNQNMN